VKCWGSNYSGHLGTGTTGDSSTPVDVVGLTGIKQISDGSFGHRCAITAQDTVKCWGLYYSSKPVDVVGITGVSQIACGSHNTVVILKDNRVRFFGLPKGDDRVFVDLMSPP
jgi:alpha-tubulin suppressor-like RCC1 family protein